jgi:plastocyanin
MKTAALFVLLSALVAPAQAQTTGVVEGTVVLRSKANAQVARSTFDRLVVYLKVADGRTISPPETVAEIRQQGARFTPPLLVVAQGQPVSFANDDDLYHNVFSYSAAQKFDLGLYKSGIAKTVRFERPGVVRTHCSIHESMNATILVVDTPFHAGPIKGPGRFTLKDVPPGRYEVHTWHPRFPTGTVAVEVKPGETAQVQVQMGVNGARK